MSYKAIDVSVFQGYINWNKVKADGITAAIIRVGGRYGASGNLYTDSRGYENLKNAISAGLKVGVYYFTQAVNEREAIEEANFTINFIKEFKKNITMPVYIDTEYLDGGRHNFINRAQRTNVCKAFCETITKAGYKAGVYGSTSWLNDKIIMGDLDKYATWVAQYYSRCTYKGAYGMWQYTSSGRINGVSGNVDVNIGYIEYWNGSSPEPVPTPTPTKLVVDGIFGYNSTVALQKWLGTYQDGEISGQLSNLKIYFPAITSVTFTGEGSTVIRALQRYLNGKGYNPGDIDGLLGKNTITALQKYLNKHAGTNLVVDGIFGINSAKAMQKYLNKVLYNA